MTSRTNRRVFRIIFMAGCTLFDINSPLGSMPAATALPDPGAQLVRAWIYLPQPVAFDTGDTVLVAGCALAPAGPHISRVIELVS